MFDGVVFYALFRDGEWLSLRVPVGQTWLPFFFYTCNSVVTSWKTSTSKTLYYYRPTVLFWFLFSFLLLSFFKFFHRSKCIELQIILYRNRRTLFIKRSYFYYPIKHISKNNWWKCILSGFEMNWSKNEISSEIESE